MSMEDLSHDFDVLTERADDCGALWAVRLLRRLVAEGSVLPPVWPGTIDEARRLVETFADRVGFNERENLAAIVQYTAEWTWADSLAGMRSPPAPTFTGSITRSASFSWHLEKLPVS
jgi:hypothetical protein